MTTTAPTNSLLAPARERDRSPTRGEPTNVHPFERTASIFAGGALAAYGLRRRDPTGLALALLGGGFVWRGARGVCPLYDALGVSTARALGPAPAATPMRVSEPRPARALSRGAAPAAKPVFVERSAALRSSPAELYALLRDPAELSRLFGDALRVERLGNAYRWALLPAELDALSFDANLVEEVPGEVLTWRARSGGPVDASVGARVVPEAGGARLTLTLRYDGGRAEGPARAIGGRLAAGAKGLLGEALRRLGAAGEGGAAGQR